MPPLHRPPAVPHVDSERTAFDPGSLTRSHRRSVRSWEPEGRSGGAEGDPDPVGVLAGPPQLGDDPLRGGEIPTARAAAGRRGRTGQAHVPPGTHSAGGPTGAA